MAIHPTKHLSEVRKPEIRVADYDADCAAIRAVRFAVFVDEQDVPPELEMDDRDRVCIHLLALGGGEPVGTARIDLGKGGKVGRLAVVASHRRRGIGRALMQALHEIALVHDLRSVWCHAQVAVIPFYEQLGYTVTSEPFDEAGIDHVEMRKTL